MARLILGVLLTLATTGALAGEIYSWKDKDGRTHYSDTPPPSGSVLAREQAPPTSAASSTDPSKAVSEQMRGLNERQAKRAEEAKKQEAAQQQQADVKQHCDNIRKRIAAFENGGRLSRMENGERIVYSDEERAAEVAEMRGLLARDCKS